MADIKLIRQYQTNQINSQGRLEPTIILDFNVGDDGPFSVAVPVSEYTADVARAAVNKLALEVASVQIF